MRDQDALRWAARRALGVLSRDDEERFAAWRDEPVNAAAYAEVSQTLRRVETLATTPEMLAMRASARATLRRRSNPSVGLIAAGVGALALMGGALLVRPPAGDAAGGSAQFSSTTPLHRYATAVGRRATLRLEDGSIAELNTASAIEVAYTPGRRDVRLLQGQALFKVAKNKHRPFVVTARDRTVTALGTMFEVRIDPTRLSVVLLEGRVAVAPSSPGGLARLGLPLGRHMLTPGERLLSSTGGDTVGPADLAQATSWRTGRLIFRDEPLAAAAAELNRYNQREIVIDDVRTGSLKVSGVFGVSEPDAFVAAATTLYPLRSIPQPGGRVKLQWRAEGQVVAPARNPASEDEERSKPSILHH